MSNVTLRNRNGESTGSVDLDQNIFGIEPNVPVMHQVVTAQLAARRSGTQSTKTRAAVRASKLCAEDSKKDDCFGSQISTF